MIRMDKEYVENLSEWDGKIRLHHFVSWENLRDEKVSVEA